MYVTSPEKVQCTVVPVHRAVFRWKDKALAVIEVRPGKIHTFRSS